MLAYSCVNNTTLHILIINRLNNIVTPLHQKRKNKLNHRGVPNTKHP